jgi:glycosyltransferase involved in cell wall biosynthesis
METIESVRQQTYKNWELIIVDDGSDDNTGELVAGINDDRIRFYKAGRVAINGKIKNIGLSKATGELIAFIDSDDLWAPTKIEKQVAALNEYPEAGFCLTGGYSFRNPGEPVEFFYKQTSGIRYDKIFISFFRSQVPALTPTLMFRRECIEKTGKFNETRTFADADFIINLAYHFKAVILYEQLFYRRLHGQNHSSLNWEMNYYNGIEIIRSFQKLLPSKIAHDALFRLYINFGEKCLVYKERQKAINKFFDAWKNKPFSIVPLKKIAKAILYSIRNK